MANHSPGLDESTNNVDTRNASDGLHRFPVNISNQTPESRIRPSVENAAEQEHRPRIIPRVSQIRRPQISQDNAESESLAELLTMQITESLTRVMSSYFENPGDENGATEFSVDLQETDSEKPVCGGYPETIFFHLSEEEKEDFCCSVCLCVLKDAFRCRNGHQFCAGCIYAWALGQTPNRDCCPVCRCEGVYASNKKIDDRICAKNVHCLEDGCNWLGYLRDFDKHSHRHYSPIELGLFSTKAASTTMNRSHEHQSRNSIARDECQRSIATGDAEESSQQAEDDALTYRRFADREPKTNIYRQNLARQVLSQLCDTIVSQLLTQLEPPAASWGHSASINEESNASSSDPLQSVEETAGSVFRRMMLESIIHDIREHAESEVNYSNDYFGDDLLTSQFSE